MTLASNFSKAKNTYRKNAIAQAKMAKKLIGEIISSTGKTDFNNIFETGCGTGLLTDEIIKNLKYKKLFLNDVTENFTSITPARYFEGDITDINIEDITVDLAASNAVFQWIDDKEKLFLKIFNVLKNNGTFAFTTFGCDNFKQIKDLTGFSLKYENPDALIKKLKNTGFKILYFEEELETLYFDNVKKILEHIKYTGVGAGTRYFWSKGKYEIFKEEYLKNFSDKNGVELTYHPMYFICRKIR